MKRIKTLTLIDDDDIFVFLTTKIIRETNLVDQIKVFENGLDALNFLKTHWDKSELLPEIIFLDLSMPIMNGWQFLEEFCKIPHKDGKKIIIYVCSSSISPDDLARSKAINAVSDYLIKPITKDKFTELIQKH